MFGYTNFYLIILFYNKKNNLIARLYKLYEVLILCNFITRLYIVNSETFRIFIKRLYNIYILQRIKLLYQVIYFQWRVILYAFIITFIKNPYKK